MFEIVSSNKHNSCVLLGSMYTRSSIAFSAPRQHGRAFWSSQKILERVDTIRDWLTQERQKETESVANPLHRELIVKAVQSSNEYSARCERLIRGIDDALAEMQKPTKSLEGMKIMLQSVIAEVQLWREDFASLRVDMSRAFETNENPKTAEMQQLLKNSISVRQLINITSVKIEVLELAYQAAESASTKEEALQKFERDFADMIEKARLAAEAELAKTNKEKP